MRRILFVFATIALSAGFAPRPAAAADVTIDTDMAEILDSFDGKGGQSPYAVPNATTISEATGTLVFFDNSNSSGKKPKLGGNIKTKSSNALANTLERARRRLFGAKQQQQTAPAAAPVFSDRSRPAQQTVMEPTGRKAGVEPKFLALDYDGEKTAAFIPPDTFVEVPFLKHIPYFFSRIEILGNGALKVTETIERVVEPSETDFYGIDRLFPKYHADRTGRKYRTNLTVLEATLDKAPVSAVFKPDMNGVKVEFRADAPLAAGTHVYQITYLYFNKIAEFKNSGDAEAPDFKELIWDITGSHWDIPVMRAGAIVIFPPDSTLYSQAAVTGGLEGVGHNYKISKDKENNLSYILTFPLAAYEGMTILANWSEKTPSLMLQGGKVDRFIIEHGTTAVALIAFLFVLSYYLATWVSLRKNRAAPDVKAAPLQRGDLSPAVLNYATAKKVTPKSLFILLLDMAAKGFLAFDEQSDGTPVLVKLTDKKNILTAQERKIAARLFSKDDTSFTLTGVNVLRLKRIMAGLQKGVAAEYRRKFTSFPHTYFLFGILMAVVAVVALSSISLFPAITAMTSAAAAVCLIPAAVIGMKIFRLIREEGFKNNKQAVLRAAAVLTPLIIAAAGLGVWYAVQTTAATTLFFYALAVCIGVFKVLLRSPSALGDSIMESARGYKLYLSSQDDTLLAVMRNAEQKIKALYAKHLPFAVALGVEQAWTHRFVAFGGGENRLKPDWYKGKLPFDDAFAETLFSEFSKAFPQEKSDKTGARPSRFKKRPL